MINVRQNIIACLDYGREMCCLQAFQKRSGLPRRSLHSAQVGLQWIKATLSQRLEAGSYAR